MTDAPQQAPIGRRGRHLLTDEWTTRRLGDLVSIKHGWPFKSDLYSEQLSGLPIVVSIGNFRYTGGFRFEETTLNEYRGEYPGEYELRPGDILLIMTCQTSGGEILGIPARVPRDGRVYLHNQRIGKVRVGQPTELFDGFAYWVFRWSRFNQHLCASASGTKILHTSPGRIESFEFTLPPFPEQRAIAEVLGSLDDKIELNRRMNQTLEATAAAVFKAWFIDFEPINAKAAGAKSFPSMPQAVFDSLPSSLVASGNPLLGTIPKTWSVASIADLAEYVNGRAFTKFANGVGRMIVRIAELNSGVGGSTQYSDCEAAPENTVNPDDLLFSWSGSLGIYRWHGDQAILNQHIFKVIPKSLPRWFVYFQLLQALAEFRLIASNKATTMGHIQRHHLSDTKLAMPPKALIDAATSVIEPVYDQIHLNEKESRTLAAMRDALLPKLLSGEVRVKSRAVAEAGHG